MENTFLGYIEGDSKVDLNSRAAMVNPYLPVRGIFRDCSSLGLPNDLPIEWMGICLTPVRIESHMSYLSTKSPSQGSSLRNSQTLCRQIDDQFNHNPQWKNLLDF